MIPAIGLMIGFYIVARMLDLRTRPDRPLHVRAFAGVALIVAIVMMVLLVLSSVDVRPPTLPLP